VFFHGCGATKWLREPSAGRVIKAEQGFTGLWPLKIFFAGFWRLGSADGVGVCCQNVASPMGRDLQGRRGVLVGRIVSSFRGKLFVRFSVQKTTKSGFLHYM
jgi:hypothetical protein